ncbi:MAG: DUF2177 family protein [Inquilinus sp.]|nr:DUF2177 family protein [Inquilinus sp.]
MRPPVIHLKAYVATLVLFLGIDALWLGVVARGFYASQLGGLMREQPNMVAAGGFYLFYVAGIVFFAVAPALAAGSWKMAALNGLLLGLIAYGTYDMTNVATLKGWPVTMSLVDMAWGGALTAASAAGGYAIARALS